MAKQTAVEWLTNHWKKLQLEGEKMSWNQIIEITELAKAMEKEQIEDAFQDGKWDWDSHLNIGTESKDLAKYYNETYKGGDNGGTN